MPADRADPFFEELYAAAGDDFERIPWAHLGPRPAVVEWLDAHPPAPGTRALVVACGLGDDAEELARRGCEVDAFDLSETAIAAARRRFPDSAVRYRVADLFALPDDWARAFGIVVEVMTIQSLPPEFHRDAVRVIAGTVAGGGSLLVRCAVRREDQPWETRPWPLKPSELAWFAGEGLTERSSAPDGDPFRFLTYERAAGSVSASAGA